MYKPINEEPDERKKMYRMALSLQIRDGSIKTFADIFAGKRFPKNYIKDDIGMSHGRIDTLLNDSETLTLKDCKRLGDYFDVPPAAIALLGFNQTAPKKKKPR